ncbi:MAG: neutral/alkaline non-lysosomal ceramidase C-terminal domain-containing protein [Deltaproteobacteria bacterium]|nr:neutral/alkaline non-lysosomal ceramidase C-terminal domain-containing protein [Deltaproteobacteria bacterium]
MVRTSWRVPVVACAVWMAVACSGPGGGGNGGGGCRYQHECSETQACVNGACAEAPTCSSEEEWTFCLDYWSVEDAVAAERAWCDLERCRIACSSDEHCGPERICTDFGECRVFTPVTTAPPGGARTALRAGYGAAELDLPIGIPLGGYGLRFGPPGRFGGGMEASVGQFDGMEARALFLDNGENPLLIVRLPVIFIDASFHEEIARILDAETGQDWREHLVVSATHTHSGPGRLWPLPEKTLLPLGLLGAGDFSDHFYRRAIRSTADAVLRALAQPVPARLGWDIVEPWDTDDAVAHDRREDSPPFDDNRVMIIRVDDTDGVPLAVLFSFGMHGTDNETNYMTDDVLGGAARGLEEALGQRHGRFVPALFINQNSGTMAPSNGGFAVPQSYDRTGALVAATLMPAIEAITTRADVHLASRSHRFEMTYESLGYTPDEWANTNDPPFGGRFRYGAFRCFEGYSPQTEADFLAPEDRNCLGLHTFLYNRPPTPLMRSLITALDIDGLSVVTQPGELSMELSWKILHTLQQEHGVDPLNAFTWGYAQDHHLYLLPESLDLPLPPFPGISTPKAPSEYPPHAFSCLRGGYEASMSSWGTREGDFLVARASEAVGRLAAAATAAGDAPPNVYTPRVEEPFPVDLTPAAEAGRVISDVPAEVVRFDQVEFAWVGGDPSAEAPQSPLVVLERRNTDGTFAEVKLRSHARYDNRSGRMVTRTRQAGAAWEWVVLWEEGKDFPAGTYRFHVDGHCQREAGAAGRQPYTATSREFTVRPLDTLSVVVDTASGVSATLAYPTGAAFTVPGALGDPGRPQGRFRARHPEVPVEVPAALEPVVDVVETAVTVRLVGQGRDETLAPVSLAETREPVPGMANARVTRAGVPLPGNLAAGTYDVTVTVTDTWGNTGTGSATLVR